jgi:hypothetical protein
MQYANSLIGRQLKTIVQTNIFHVYDLTDELYFLLTKAVSILTALLWYTEIKNLDEYLVSSLGIDGHQLWHDLTLPLQLG